MHRSREEIAILKRTEAMIQANGMLSVEDEMREALDAEALALQKSRCPNTKYDFEVTADHIFPSINISLHPDNNYTDYAFFGNRRVPGGGYVRQTPEYFCQRIFLEGNLHAHYVHEYKKTPIRLLKLMSEGEPARKAYYEVFRETSRTKDQNQFLNFIHKHIKATGLLPSKEHEEIKHLWKAFDCECSRIVNTRDWEIWTGTGPIQENYPGYRKDMENILDFIQIPLQPYGGGQSANRRYAEIYNCPEGKSIRVHADLRRSQDEHPVFSGKRDTAIPADIDTTLAFLEILMANKPPQNAWADTFQLLPEFKDS